MKIYFITLFIISFSACSSHRVDVEYQYYDGSNLQKIEDGFYIKTKNEFHYYFNSDSSAKVSKLIFDGTNLVLFDQNCPIIDTINIIEESYSCSFFVYKYDRIDENDDEEFIVATNTDGLLVKYSYVWDTYYYYKTDDFKISIYDSIIRHLKESFDILPPVLRR